MVTKRIGMISVFCTVLLGFLPEMNAPIHAKEPSHSPAARQREAKAGDPFSKALRELEGVNVAALRRAIRDLMKTFFAEYIHGEDYLRVLDACEKRLGGIKDALRQRNKNALRQAEGIVAFQRQVLLSNPLLNFDKLLLIKRKPLDDPRRARGDRENDKGLGRFLGLPQQSSWQLHTMSDTDGWDNEICVFSPVGPEGELTRLYRPSGGRLINEMDLYFDADRLMFSMPDRRKLWQVFEIRTDGTGLRQVSPDDQPDVHNFDSCYLPNGKIAFVPRRRFRAFPVTHP